MCVCNGDFGLCVADIPPVHATSLVLRFYLTLSQLGAPCLKSHAGTRRAAMVSYQATEASNAKPSPLTLLACVQDCSKQNVSARTTRKAKSSFSSRGTELRVQRRHQEHSVDDQSLDKLELSLHNKNVTNLRHMLAGKGSSSFGSSFLRSSGGVRACRRSETRTAQVL